MHSFALVMPTSGLTTIAKLRTELPCCVGIGIPKFQIDSSIIFRNIAKSLMGSLLDFFLKWLLVEDLLSWMNFLKMKVLSWTQIMIQVCLLTLYIHLQLGIVYSCQEKFIFGSEAETTGIIFKC